MDTYTGVAQEVAADAARKLAASIPRTALHPARTLGPPSGQQQTSMDSATMEGTTMDNTKPQVNTVENLGCGGAPSGTRTPNPLVKSRDLPVSGGDA